MFTTRYVETVTGEFLDVVASRHEWSGSDDHTVSEDSILEVITRDGRRWHTRSHEDWVECAPGIATRVVNRAEQVRIWASACPVRLRILHVTRYVSSDPEYYKRQATESLVTYVSDRTTLLDRALLQIRFWLNVALRRSAH